MMQYRSQKKKLVNGEGENGRRWSRNNNGGWGWWVCLLQHLCQVNRKSEDRAARNEVRFKKARFYLGQGGEGKWRKSILDFRERFAHSESQETSQVGGRWGEEFEGKHKVYQRTWQEVSNKNEKLVYVVSGVYKWAYGAAVPKDNYQLLNIYYV